MIHWIPHGLDFDGDHNGITCPVDLRGHHCCVDADGKPIPQWTPNDELTDEQLVQLCKKIGCIPYPPWFRRLQTWSRLWWRVARQWVRGIER